MSTLTILIYFFILIFWVVLVQLVTFSLKQYLGSSLWFFISNWIYFPKLSKNKRKSLFLNLFFEFVSIYDFLKIPESLSSIIKDFGLLDSFSYNLVEYDLESKRYSRAIKIAVVIFTYFFYFGVGIFLGLFFAGTGVGLFVVVRHVR